MRAVWIFVLGAALLGAAGVVYFLFALPPDWTGRGVTRMEIVLLGNSWGRDEQTFVSVNPTVIEGVLQLFSQGASIERCRCAPVGSIEFHGPGSERRVVSLRPGHAVNEIQFDYDRARYSLRRDALLSVVSELGIPADRWDHQPPPMD